MYYAHLVLKKYLTPANSLKLTGFRGDNCTCTNTPIWVKWVQISEIGLILVAEFIIRATSH